MKMNSINLLSALFQAILLVAVLLWSSTVEAASTCSANMQEKDPNLHEITFDVGYGTEHFEVYIQPNLTSMMRSSEHVSAKTPQFNGLAAKFFNMSPETVMLYWDPMTGQAPSIIAKLPPFSTSGTASFPGHNFLITKTDYNHATNRLILKRFVVSQDISNYYYDPLENSNDPEETQLNLATLTYKQYEIYEKMKRTQKFNIKYKDVTGREYLSHYPRDKPQHFMWRAHYFGQTHWVTSQEVHFRQLPSSKDLQKISHYGTKRILKEDEPRHLSQYRVDEPYLNMTLKVLSCAPRAFEIKNFLSDVETDHILNLAGVLNLSRSKTGDGGNVNDQSETRTSFNTWVTREQDLVVDAIYRRAADLLRIDEALMRYRGDGEYPKLGTETSIAEQLQLVRYSNGQEYTAHHDFGYSEVDDARQPNRFATILFYLNEGMVGGETEFPRFVNGETSQGLKVTPEKGKAVLFYSHLPDGNMDDLSQHAALPVTEGIKLLTNLWVWDPVYEN